MEHCIVCRETIAKDWVVVPSPTSSPMLAHRQCITDGFQSLPEDKRKLVQFILDYESRNNIDFKKWLHGYKSYIFGWTAADINISPAKLRQLLEVGIIGVSYRSRSTTCYALSDKTLIGALLEEVAYKPMPVGPEAATLPADLFTCIVGYDDIKDEIKHTLTTGVRSHYLLIGPPATAKSLFLLEIARLPGCYFATGSTVRGPGLTDALKTYQPAALLLDEADKVSQDTLAVLLSVMETGEVLETKYKRHDKVTLRTIVFAAANSTSKMAPEFLSRFAGGIFHFQEYSRSDFIDVCFSYLTKYEKVTPYISRYVAAVTYDYLGRDIRLARGVARRLRRQTPAEVDRVVSILQKYR